MSNAFFKVPQPVNEPVKNYATNSSERILLKEALMKAKQTCLDIPMYIDGKEVRTNKKIAIHPPHELQHVLGYFHRGEASHVQQAIEAALSARKKWSQMPWQDRSAIFLRAAELLAGPYRYEMNAATMLGQSKNVYQAEIDSACEFIDFLRFNVAFMTQIYADQPISSTGIWNSVEYRPLEGFVFAITPFNFTAIAGNLCAAPALMGNVVVWKPADSQVYSAQLIMKIFKEAGLPDGVINLVYTDGPEAGDIVFKHPDFAGLHFTGSTKVFKHLWKEIANNIDIYKTYPRIVGETGGKDFIVAHTSAKPMEVATAISRGAFEYQGQKCSAASRAYLPASIADEILALLQKDIASFKMGSTEDFGNFINAVISEESFDKIANFIEFARKSKDARIIAGGNYDKTRGYFIEPTVILTSNPQFRTLCEEIFGPVITVFIYEDKDWEKTLELIDQTSVYALTGAVFSNDRYATIQAKNKLQNAAGNFYINDKPTGAVVGQQPFGGARGSGTNDKAGSAQNLLRWCSVRTIKETMVPPTHYAYPFLEI